MTDGLPGRVSRIRPGPPPWLAAAAALALLAVVASLLIAVDRTNRIGDRIEDIGRSMTIAGWRNDAAVDRAVATDGEISRLRSGRLLAWSSCCFSVAASAFLAVLALRDRRRRGEMLQIMAAELKAGKAEVVRGFISQHIDTLAQKRSELRTANAYGVVDDSAWHQELVYFINRVLRPNCRVDADVYSFVELRAMIERQISMLG